MERRIQEYISGRMSAAEAEAFEARMMADDELAVEVERAIEIRAAVQDSTAASDHVAQRPRARMRPGWAIAAGVAVLAVGISWLGLRPTEPVFRGAEQSLGVQFEVANGVLNAYWPDAPGAKGYELQLYAADGRLVHSVEITTPTANVNLRGPELAGAAAPPAFVEVAALDEFGQTLMRSQRMVLGTDVPVR